MRSMPDSPLAQALDRIGDRWSLLIIDALQESPLRFSELSERVEGIASNILSSRLTRLEQDGVIVATPYTRRPLRHAYELTAAGRDLAGALRLLAHWGSRHGGDSIRHDLCGTALEPQWYCPSCDRAVDPAQSEIHRA